MTTAPRNYAATDSDHRVIDGVGAARFLQELARLLENPETLLEGAGA